MKAFGLGVLLDKVLLQTVSTAAGETCVLNNRVVSYAGKEKKHYISIVAWGAKAQIIANNFEKGDEIFLEGILVNTPINAAKYGNLCDSTIQVDDIMFTHGRRSQIGEGGC